VKRQVFILSLLAVVLPLMCLASLCFGGSALAPGEVLSALFTQSEQTVLNQIVIDFRLPRILTAVLAGSALATAGLIMQTIFRNPLADPFVLGVNAGASLGVAVVLLALAPAGSAIIGGLNLSGQLLIITAATGGTATTLMLVLILSRRVDVMSVLIIGLMLSYAIGAVVSILMFFSMAERLQSFISWSFGDYGQVSWTQMQVFAPAIFLGLVACWLCAKPLDALLLGETYAQSIGTRVKSVRLFTLLAASILAGAVTGFCGPIGFLGIAAPHLARQLFKTSQHLVLIPASILIGALLSVAADFLARGPGLDTVLPLNAITALVGAPVIIFVLMRRRAMKGIFQ
jgi:iron complex transport system permease protein